MNHNVYLLTSFNLWSHGVYKISSISLSNSFFPHSFMFVKSLHLMTSQHIFKCLSSCNYALSILHNICLASFLYLSKCYYHTHILTSVRLDFCKSHAHTYIKSKAST
ncbi:dubious [Schizosaccharomyces pombe]|uniref:Putative uncharacterized protein C1A6.11 n=1 Tax=Schizosaccharomyces pombe (strain 972 / ATCC 24843) TaxID=284812 RepID=YEXB_SCHPO|nr:uncharacterized protein SPAC1A6.11 [Schizosaccharomyces pombe]Q9C114.1 RecName: Full=Putative uncharacterized protein C1A6.11 [Schizosaccharomyces pombe 972h-]CAC34961.1 dubious [Schizosaccharomyces pombe]|eukprot:NP_593195.1 uncharacterized protein SPAC1A6.11 [Schizosaccharomyces pombe]